MFRLSKEKKPESASRPRAQAPGHVREVLRSPGKPLDTQVRSFFESRFRLDFSKVRVHTDERAAESAESINALAYTAGRDVVFAQGEYAPGTQRGQQLLVHELAHIVQQGGMDAIVRSGGTGSLPLGAADHSSERQAFSAVQIVELGWNPCSHPEITSRELTPVVRRAGPDDEKWNPAYRSRLSKLDKPYEQFKAGLGDIRETTKGGLSENVGRPIPKRQGAGTPAASKITMPTLLKIYPGLAADVAADPNKAAKAQLYLDKLNEAFKIMKIDTAEAQALYLAHAFVESDQFRQFTETQGAVNKGAQKWMDNPTQAKLDEGDLKARYPEGKDVNPMGKFEFIGRGPVQVTHRPEYVETIAMLEKTAEQYQKDTGNKEAQKYADLAREAAREIKANPKQAANPKYSFLVSAAFMKKFGVDVGAAEVDPNKKWTGKDTASGWVAGGKLDAKSLEALGKKQEKFKEIRSVLIDEAKKPKGASGAAVP
jgi:hypothetical protein